VTPGVLTSTITVPGGSGTISRLAVEVGLVHPFIGDIKLRLTHGGVTVPLVVRPGVLNDATDVGYSSNYNGVYIFHDLSAGDVWASANGGADEYDLPAVSYHPSRAYGPALPSPSLAVFNGQAWAGTWTLTAEDWWNLYAGTVTSFALRTVSPVVCAPVCGHADFNCDGDIGTDADIEAFFRCLAGNCPAPPCTGAADFNGDGDIGTDADIEAFFRVLAGGAC
jgi:subtilisin-like proprotein convertase family protein